MGFVVVMGEAAAILVYVLVGPTAAPTALWVVASGTVLFGVAGLAVSRSISTRTWRGRFVIVCTVATVAALGFCQSLDGGLDSPLLFLTVVPIMFAGLVLSPSGVAISTVVSMAAVAAVGLVDRHIEQPQAEIFMFSSALVGVGLLAFASAIYRARLESDRSRLVAHLERLAASDSLTGCANQDRFHEQLRTDVSLAQRHGRPLSLLMCDVDLFKSYNDTHGHEQGDQALAAVGACLQRSIRASDLVGRVGGDEFAILLPETDLLAASLLAARLVAECPADGPTLSVGVAALSDEVNTPTMLFEAADAAMYGAKSEGRRRYSAQPWATATSNEWVARADDRRSDEVARWEQRRRIEAEMTFASLIQEAPVGIALVDPAFRIQVANPAFVELSAGHGGRVQGRTIAEVMPVLWSELEPHLLQVVQELLPIRNLEITVPDSYSVPGTRLASFHPVVLGDKLLGIGMVVVDISDRKAAEQAQERVTDTVVATLAATAEARDPYTAGHQRRVAQLTAKIAAAMGCDPWTVKGMALAAAVHDIGKIAIPSEILTRPGRLSDTEMALVRDHVQVGYDLISQVEYPWPVGQMVLQHHERLDGSGYPNGRRGEEIGLGGRVIAVADVVEAMAAHRPYRPARGIDAALDVILEGRGSLFDEQVVDICVALFRRGEFTLEEGLGTDAKVTIPGVQKP